MEFILDNNDDFINFIEKLNNLKSKKEKEFLNTENELINFQNEIKNINEIYSKEEVDSKINEYNEKFNSYQLSIEEFNFFLNENLNNNRTIILKKIGNIAETISSQNNIDIIIDSENYFLSSENIDISELIIKELNKSKIIFEISDE